jgi:hypothetical protein
MPECLYILCGPGPYPSELAEIKVFMAKGAKDSAKDAKKEVWNRDCLAPAIIGSWFAPDFCWLEVGHPHMVGSTGTFEAPFSYLMACAQLRPPARDVTAAPLTKQRLSGFAKGQ